MNEIEKGKEGEDAVSKVISETYLKYWCFPDPKDENGNKKQICDLLILFKEYAIIIEVKNYEFKGNYERYFNNTLPKAIAQIKGAERKLFNSNRKLSFIHAIHGEINFEPEKYTNVIRIIVNLSTVPLFYPGCDNLDSKFIHIFNWFGFLKIIQELDAIPDYIEYLQERERTFKNKQLVIASGKENDWTIDTNNQFMHFSRQSNPTVKPLVIVSGNELDLLADYYLNGRKFSKELYSTEYNGMHFQIDDKWMEFSKREEVRKKKIADEKSYFFDKLITREVLFYEDERRIEIAAELLSLNRFERRIAGDNFDIFIRKYMNIGPYFMARRFGTFGDLAIGYFIHGNSISLDQSMQLMSVAAQGFSYWEKYKSKKVLIIGINSGLTQTKFVYINKVEELHGQEKEDLEYNLKELNWFTNIEVLDYKNDEFPNE